MATILVDYENVSAADVLKGVEYLNKKDTKSLKFLYTSSLHEFGREDGRAIYQMLKNDYTAQG